MSDLAKRLRAYAKDQGGWHNIDETCEEAADRIEALERLVRILLDNDPDEPIADNGMTVLDGWRQEARAAFAKEMDE